jgi:hypothetical protein
MKVLRSIKLAGQPLLTILTLFVMSASAMAATNSWTARTALAGNWVFADFNGDHKPDLAELYRTSLNLQLSSGDHLQIPIELYRSTPGAEIIALDVDGDNDLDILVRNRFFPQPVKIWLNDGTGTFTETLLRRDPLPNERESWNQSIIAISNIAFTNGSPKPLAGLKSSRFVLPPSFVRKAQIAPERLASRHHDDNSQLRAPPSSL